MTNVLAAALADFRPVIAARYVNLVNWGQSEETSLPGCRSGAHGSAQRRNARQLTIWTHTPPA